MSRTRKINTYKTNKSNKSKRTNKQNQHIKKTARIIIKDNVGGIVADKDSIKELLESKGKNNEKTT